MGRAFVYGEFSLSLSLSLSLNKNSYIYILNYHRQENMHLLNSKRKDQR